MRKILVFTDPHITPRGESIIGLDPLERFNEGLTHALTHHPNAERVVITGDLTHHGTPGEYMLLHEALRECPVPVSLTLGNHDRRTAFRKAFPEISLTDQGFAQEIVDLDETRIILLDTLDEMAPDLHSGLLCDHRLDWLEAALKGADGRRAMIFMHHPPVLTGFDGMDSIGLRNRVEFARRLSHYSNVKQIIAGHIHRTLHAALPLEDGRVLPVISLKSTCHQMPMALGLADHHVSVDEPGAYGIVIHTKDGIVVHTEDFTLPTKDTQPFDT